MKQKKDDYIWWAAPVTILMFTLWFVLHLLGIPLSIAFGINVVFDLAFWLFYSIRY